MYDHEDCRQQLEIDHAAVLPGVVVRGRRNPLHFGLAARLRRARRAAGLSFGSLARTAGVNHANTVFQLESKPGHVPRLDTVERIASALGLSPGFLAYGIEADTDKPVDDLRCEGVGSRLRQTRIHLGLSVLALATAAGLSHTAVGNVERGTMPTVATAEALATALGVSPGWLAYGLGPIELPGQRRAAASPAPSLA